MRIAIRDPKNIVRYLPSLNKKKYPPHLSDNINLLILYDGKNQAESFEIKMKKQHLAPAVNLF